MNPRRLLLIWLASAALASACSAQMLQVNGTLTLCGYNNTYTTVIVNSTGTLLICNYTSGNTGYLDLYLGANGNFTVKAGGRVVGVGAGGPGGEGTSAVTGATQGMNGATMTVGSQATTANGGGGGGADKGSKNDAAGGGGGGFGGAGGNGSVSVAGTIGDGGGTYGSPNNDSTPYRGSGGGGGASDTAFGGGSGGGGLRVKTESGVINVWGVIDVNGSQGNGTTVGAEDQGAGGGGSGGHIILYADKINVSGGSLYAAGGAGGDAYNMYSDNCGGGGGGGGRIYIAGYTVGNLTVASSVSVTGGVKGLSAGGYGSCMTTRPLPGGNGTYVTNKTNTPPTISLKRPSNGAKYLVMNVTFNCSVSDDLGVANVTLYGNWTGVWHANETNSSGINNANYIFFKSLSNGNHSWNCRACDTNGNCSFAAANYTLSNRSGIKYEKYRSHGETTDLDYIGSSNTAVSLVLDDVVLGKVKFAQNVLINSSFDLDAAVDVGQDYIYVDSGMYPALNKPANITFYSVSLAVPVILKDGAPCTDCSILGFNSATGLLTFNVSGFSNYTAAEANQSKVVNNGPTNTSLYLLMKTQYWSGSWVEEDVVVNDSVSRFLENGSTLKLDTLWNGLNYTTGNLSHGDGTYRVYVAVMNSSGGILENYDGSALTAAYNFTYSSVVTTCVPTTGLDWVIDASEWCYILGKDYAVGNISFINNGGITFDNSNVSAASLRQKTQVVIAYKPPYRMIIKLT